MQWKKIPAIHITNKGLHPKYIKNYKSLRKFKFPNFKKQRNNLFRIYKSNIQMDNKHMKMYSTFLGNEHQNHKKTSLLCVQYRMTIKQTTNNMR
jgi:hypothetical protein